ncbi:MAG: ABC-type nitrate/sulfonate/bicarbonate transport system, substrate-binding protein, partial [Sphingomonadales bacterium]|nr:ABC-type nitrate/sulfonate/bicarbonate transport system, substrate-binding protein [Sphingomonadales bacterium]
MKKIVTGFICLFAAVAGSPSFAQAPQPLSIVVFGAPSLGAFLPPVIKA